MIKDSRIKLFIANAKIFAHKQTKKGEKMKEYLFPKKIVSGKTKNNQNLLKKQPLQIGLAEVFTTKFKKGDSVVLDFGKEMCGGLRILTFSGKDVKVRIRFGESLNECFSDIGVKNATNDHALRDFCVLLQNYSDMTFGNTGFRFVKLDFYGTAEIKTVVAENNILKRKSLYTYTGEDKLIREIFKTAKRTVDLCASSGYVWDGVKRDRLVWIGDMHPETIALTTLYGRMEEIERSLDFVKEQTPLPNWMNRFPTYSMWWIIILADYYERTNAEEFTAKQMDYLSALVNQIDGCVKEDGEIVYPSYFVDWPTCGKKDVVHGTRAINVMAIKGAIKLLKAFKKDTTVANGVLEKLLKVEIAPTESKQVYGLKYFATSLTESDKKALTEGGAKGMSTFMSYYILKAVASFDKQKAIEMMKEFYGAMLDKGATSFWEDFSMDWVKDSCKIDEFPKGSQKDIHGDYGAYCYTGFRHSLCHGWSAGVIRFIEEEC